MAHMLDHSRGRAALYLAEKPGWHDLGIVTSEAKNSEEAMKLGLLDWLVERWRCIALAPAESKFALNVDTAMANVDSVVRLVRSDTGSELGIVSADYQPLQNHQLFDFLDSMVEDGEALYESCGAVKGGKEVFALLRVPKLAFATKGNDEQLPYLLATAAHDGSRAARILFTSIRVVCWNTLSAALGNDRGVYIRHTGDMEQKLKDAKLVLGTFTSRYQEYQKWVKAFARKEVTEKSLRDYYLNVLPINPNVDPQDEDAVRIERRNGAWRTRFEQIFQGEPDLQIPGAKGTLWGAVNAVTRFVDWNWPVRGKDDNARNESRLRSAWFGEGDRIKSAALEQAVALVN